jgi:hypothetical protein
MAAGHRGNTDDVDTLLRSGTLPAEVPGGTDGRRVDVDGDRMAVAL